MNKLLVFWFAMTLLVVGLICTWYIFRRAGDGPAVGQEETDYGPPLEHFQLTQSTGDSFNSQSLDGQVWVTNFFYSSCPSICLRENIVVQELEQEFGERGVKFVSITIDPTNDTPSRLDEYSKRFNADPSRWFFLTGRMDYIVRIGKDIFKTPIEPGGHTERLFVIGRKGEIRGAFHFQNPVEMQEMRTMLNQLLAEDAEAESEPDAEAESVPATVEAEPSAP